MPFSPSAPSNPPAVEPTGAPLSPEAALHAFQQDPIAFIRQEIRQAVHTTMLTAHEDGQARVAMEELARQNPGASEFMPLIIAEVKTIIANDDDGVLAPWPLLFQQGLERLSRKLETHLAQNKSVMEPGTAEPSTPFVEMGRLQPSSTPVPKSFTRQEIDRMSLEDYMRQEQSIRDALKNGRIT
jgi:hypothetical protein